MSTRFTITSASGSSTQDFPGEAPEQVYFEDLQPGTSYSVTAELYYGDTVIDTDTKTFKTSIEYITDAFYLQNEVESENVLTLSKTGTPKTTDLEYSLDEGSNWTAFDLTQTTNTVTIPAAGRVYLRSSTGFSSDYYNYLIITCSKSFSVHGNLQCLHNYKDISDLSVDGYEFRYLFSNATTLLSAKYMYLPATTLATYCYQYMFNDCTALTEAPALPATTLETYCYQYMFNDCTALTEAPSLPATTLANYCYAFMFNGCTALTEAPSLPATTLAEACYQFMFSGCTSLTTAPTLPATTLRYYCYEGMFKGCTSITEAPALPAKPLAEACYRSMFYNCTALTEAPELPATTLAHYCYRYMFYNCTALTVAPELPATTLKYSCYASMFYGCTSLTESQALPATTLASGCYEQMFRGCSKLQSVTTYVTTWNTLNTDRWLASAGTKATNPTVYCPADSTIPSDDYSGIPEGWTRADL